MKITLTFDITIDGDMSKEEAREFFYQEFAPETRGLYVDWADTMLLINGWLMEE